jgi:hypothetical protein
MARAAAARDGVTWKDGGVSTTEPAASQAMPPLSVETVEPSLATLRPRVVSVDMLKVILVSWVIGGHALLGYAAIGGWPYDEVQEATIPPHVELALSVILGPTALFVIGTFFFLAGMFAPGARARLGAGGFVWRRLVRLGLPWLTFVVLVWPISMWLAYRAAGHDVLPWETFLHRQPFLDSGPLWFAQVLLYVSIAYALWPRLDPRHHAGAPPRQPVIGPQTLALAILLIATASFLVRLKFPARSQQVLDLHLWQWPQCVGMFALGVLASPQGWYHGFRSASRGGAGGRCWWRWRQHRQSWWPSASMTSHSMAHLSSADGTWRRLSWPQSRRSWWSRGRSPYWTSCRAVAPPPV